MKAELRVTAGPLTGRKIELGRLGSFNIGRLKQNDLDIVEKAVSRKHCRIDYDGEHFWVVDCGSHNGTLVNGKRITKSLLYHGDVIKIGHSRMVFELREQQSQEPS